VVLFFYGEAVPTCPGCVLDSYPSLNYSLTIFNEFQTYTFDPSATVRVGFNASHPVSVSWPYPNQSPWDWWDDPTPNKTGLHDLGALISNTWQFLKSQINSASVIIFPTLGPGGLLVSATENHPNPHHAPQVVNTAQTIWDRLPAKARMIRDLKPSQMGAITGLMADILQAAGALTLALTNSSSYTQLMDKTVESMTGVVSASDVDASTTPPFPVGPFTTWQEVLQAWLDFIISLILCPWQELAFNGKRFSLGFTFIYFLIALLLLIALAEAWVGGNIILITVVMSLAVGLTAFVLWMLITYEYGLLCFPAVPLGVWADVLYFLAYSLLPKCLIFMGVTNAPYYNNDNCYSCENWIQGTFPVPNYWWPIEWGGLYGFTDIRFNIAFILKAAFPSLWTALRPGGSIYTLPGVSSILGNPFFQTPLARFSFWDPATIGPTLFRTYWLGATFVTLIPNLILAAALAFILLRLFGPVFWQFLNFLLSVFWLMVPVVFFVLTSLYMVAHIDQTTLLIRINAATARFESRYASPSHQQQGRMTRRRRQEEREQVGDEENQLLVKTPQEKFASDVIIEMRPLGYGMMQEATKMMTTTSSSGVLLF